MAADIMNGSHANTVPCCGAARWHGAAPMVHSLEDTPLAARMHAVWAASISHELQSPHEREQHAMPRVTDARR